MHVTCRKHGEDDDNVADADDTELVHLFTPGCHLLRVHLYPHLVQKARCAIAVIRSHPSTPPVLVPFAKRENTTTGVMSADDVLIFAFS